MREEASHQQRQQHVEVVSQLHREDDAREGRAHRAAEDRAHADQRPEPETEVRKENRFNAAEGRAHHQQMARGRRRMFPSPSEIIQISRLHQQNAGKDRSAEHPLEQHPDRVVANAQGLRENQPAQADEQPADRGPPHPVNRQPF